MDKLPFSPVSISVIGISKVHSGFTSLFLNLFSVILIFSHLTALSLRLFTLSHLFSTSFFLAIGFLPSIFIERPTNFSSFGFHVLVFNFIFEYLKSLYFSIHI